jgi:hypothetical protein
MRIFKTAWFVRFARGEGISDDLLREAIRRAKRGQIDAQLGGEVVKQRLPKPGQGRSGGYRAIILFRLEGRAVYAYGYAKNRRAGLRPDEVAQFKRMAAQVLALTETQLELLIARGQFEEVPFND